MLYKFVHRHHALVTGLAVTYGYLFRFSFAGAFTFGLIMRATPFLRELLGLKEDDPFPPLVHFVFALGWLAVTALFWSRSQQITPPGLRLILICCVAGLSLYNLWQGVVLMRRGVGLGGEVQQ